MSFFPAKTLLATDGSNEAARATRVAQEISGKTGSELHVVHVNTMPGGAGAHPLEAPMDPRYGPYIIPESADPGEQRKEEPATEMDPQEFLEHQAELIRQSGGEVAGTHHRIGRPAEEIIGLSEEINADLIVTGSRGLSPLKRLILGSTSEVVVRYASCSVLVVREGRPDGFPHKILLATDGSKEAELAARAAAELAEKTGAELDAVHVAHAPVMAGAYAEQSSRETAEAARELLDEQAGLVREAGAELAETHTLVGSPAEKILGLAEDIEADLVVVGSRGLSEIKRLVLGSVSESVVRHAPCPVLMVRRKQDSG